MLRLVDKNKTKKPHMHIREKLSEPPSLSTLGSVSRRQPVI